MTTPKCTNILLIGKYPPLQGGIASKTFWLCDELLKHGFSYRIVTTKYENYSISDKEIDHNVFCLDLNETPWHIPNSDLFFDRLLYLSNKALINYDPDIIETNYLWPFCSVAIYLAEKLSKPLIIRHAGSDILKFHESSEFKPIIESYFQKADIVVTNSTINNIISSLCHDKSKIMLMDRYVPNPDIFFDKKTKKKYDILFAGKLNYHWKLKGIEYLLNIIKANKLTALFIIGGNYIVEVQENIAKQKLENNITTIPFVHPKEMPDFFNKCKCVWCWEEQGSIEDFSNIIWEACLSKVPCILNSNMERTNELKRIVKIFPDLFKFLNAGDIEKVSFQNKPNFNSAEALDNLNNIYESYVLQNINLYKALL